MFVFAAGTQFKVLVTAPNLKTDQQEQTQVFSHENNSQFFIVILITVKEIVTPIIPHHLPIIHIIK